MEVNQTILESIQMVSKVWPKNELEITSRAMTFAEKLKLLMESRNLSATELAKQIRAVTNSKLSDQTIYNYKDKPDVLPRLDVARVIANIFDVPLAYLAYDHIEEVPPKSTLSRDEERILDAARVVGFELALKRIMNVPDSETLPGTSLKDIRARGGPED